jgi:superfamily II DNA or RNA helicase
MNRTQRQIQVLKRWAQNDYKGIFQAATGFGKTYTAIMAIKGMVTRADIQSCLVVVPTIALKNQWEKELETHKVKFAEVLVINTVIKKQREYDMIVLDECHRYAAENFKKVFELVDYKYILGLTATLEREDGLHELILDYLNVIDEVTVDDALDNNWISPYIVYNVAVPLPADEQTDYNKSNNAFKHYAAKLGYGGQAFKNAQAFLRSSDKAKQGQAGAYYNAMRKRKNICLNNSAKIDAVDKIIKSVGKRNGLIFSATTEFAELLQDKLGDICMTFHSKITKKIQKDIVARFKDKRTKVRYLSTVKALNEGFNVPDCSLAIIAGSNSTKRTFIQQLGRVVRMQPDKKAVIVNLYSPETQDEVWMRKRLDGIDKNRVIFCNLEDFLNQFIYGNNPEFGADEADQTDPESANIVTFVV